MERWIGRIALVTGASSGIGAATARALVRNGMTVIGCARNLDRIKAIQTELEGEAAKGKLHPVQCDLSKRDEITAMFKMIRKEYKCVDVCINNAGLSFDAPLVKGNPDEWQTMLDINVMALCICTQESVKLMMDKKVDDGQVIHINSMSGHRIVSGHFYSATKYAVTALTEGLRKELRALKTHIRVSSISPGLVETEFLPRMYGDNPQKGYDVYNKNQCLQAEDIANQVIHILQQPPHVQIHDVWMRSTEQVA